MNRQTILRIFAACDILTFLSTTSLLTNLLTNNFSGFLPLTIVTGALLISLPFSAYFTFLQTRTGFIIYFFQFLPRLAFVVLTFGFLTYVNTFLGLDIDQELTYLAMILELVRLIYSIRNYKA